MIAIAVVLAIAVLASLILWAVGRFGRLGQQRRRALQRLEAAPDMWDPSDREERSYQQRRPRLTHRRIGGQR